MYWLMTCLGSPCGFDAAVEQKDGAMRELLHQTQIVRDEEHGDFALAQFFEFADAAVGEDGIADGQRFVNDQNVRIDMDCGGKCQPHIHAARIFLDRAVHEFADFRKRFDEGRLARFRARPMPMISPLMKTFSRPREFGVEARAEFQQRRDAPARHNPSRGGLQDAADDLQQRALAAAVGSHQAEHFAAFDAEADVAQRPEIGVERLRIEGQQLRAGGRRDEIQAVKLGYVLNQNH